MRSGIKPGNTFIEDIKDLKFNEKSRCMIFSITKPVEKNVNPEFYIEHKCDNSFAHKDLYDMLPHDNARFIVTDFHYETEENPPRKTNKLIFIFWCPSQTPTRDRFTYSTSISDFVNAFGSIQKQFQTSDISEVDFEAIRKELLRK